MLYCTICMHRYARVLQSPTLTIFFSNNPYHKHEFNQEVGPPGLTHLTYHWREREQVSEENETQAFMHACVCSNHPISPLIIVQSSKLSLYSMFALLHGEFTVTQDKQSACCIRSKQNVYVYTLFCESSLNS